MQAIVVIVLILLGIWLLRVVLVLVLAAFLLVPDTMARAFAWAGVHDPATGWALLGAVLGALVGLAMGLRRAGRPPGRARVATVGTLVVAALLAAGLGARGVEARTVARPVAPGVTRSTTVVVRADRATVRAWPSTDARVLGALPRGTVLTVDSTSADGQWYAVGVKRGRTSLVGWVFRDLVAWR